MSTAILRKIVDSGYLNNTFSFKRAHIHEKESNESNPKFHSYLCFSASAENKTAPVNKGYSLYKDSHTNRVRMVRDPKEIKREMRRLALVTPFYFALTLLQRAVEVVVLIADVFFKTYSDVYAEKNSENLAERFTKRLSLNLTTAKNQFLELCKKVRLDFYSAPVMELSALSASFSNDDTTIFRMQVLFSETEFEWNDKMDPQKTYSFHLSDIRSEFNKIHDPLIKLYLIQKSVGSDHDDEIVALIALEMERMKVRINEMLINTDTILDNEDRTKCQSHLRNELSLLDLQPKKWLTANIGFRMSHRIRQDEIDLFKEMIQSDTYKDMTPKELQSSKNLEIAYTLKYFKPLFYDSKGLMLYQCSRPFTLEKENRIQWITGKEADTYKAFKETCLKP